MLQFLVSVIGVVFFITGIIWTSYIITRTIIYNDLDKGWPALISILLVGFGITNIGLGIIAEYLWRTFDSSRKRPVFLIKNIIEIKNINK
jgi:dolichol-phosphate mannosyltransferase